MKCVICKKNPVEGFLGDIAAKNFDNDHVTCVDCRGDHYPKHMKHSQYQRYWEAFSKKWRDENDLHHM
jgi:hypothetical protein